MEDCACPWFVSMVATTTARTGTNAVVFLCNVYLEVRKKEVKDPFVSLPQSHGIWSSQPRTHKKHSD